MIRDPKNSRWLHCCRFPAKNWRGVHRLKKNNLYET